MASTRTSPPSTSTVPPWASFFSPRELGEFTRMVEAESAARGLDLRVPVGPPSIALPGGGERFDLASLARSCDEHPVRRWPAVIAGAFERVAQARLDPEALLAQLADFDALRRRLKVRIHAAFAFSAPQRERLLIRPLAEGLVALLVCDLDVANVSVPREQVLRWGSTPEAIWSLAIENVRAERRLQAVRGAPRGERAVDMLAGATAYASSHLLFFERYFRGDPRYGALVALPQRHVILRHVIRDESVLAVVPFLHAAAVDAFECGPGPISTRIYWWRPGGRIELLSLRVAQGSIVVCPSRELQEQVIDPLLHGR